MIFQHHNYILTGGTYLNILRIMSIALSSKGGLFAPVLGLGRWDPFEMGLGRLDWGRGCLVVPCRSICCCERLWVEVPAVVLPFLWCCRWDCLWVEVPVVLLLVPFRWPLDGSLMCLAKEGAEMPLGPVRSPLDGSLMCLADDGWDVEGTLTWREEISIEYASMKETKDVFDCLFGPNLNPD